MPRIVLCHSLSNFFSPKYSILNNLSRLNSAVFQHPLHSPTLRLLAPLYTIFKSASVTPLLKKPALDKSLPSNYRAISNHNTISNVLERLFLNRVQASVVSSLNLNQFQNVYWPRNSTETCVLATLDKICSSSDSGNSTLLVLSTSMLLLTALITPSSSVDLRPVSVSTD